VVIQTSTNLHGNPQAKTTHGGADLGQLDRGIYCRNSQGYREQARFVSRGFVAHSRGFYPWEPRSLVLANIDPWQDLRQSIPQNIEWTLHLYTAVVYAAQKTCSLTYLLVWTSSWFPEFAHIPTLSPTFKVLMNSSAIGKLSSLSISF